MAFENPPVKCGDTGALPGRAAPPGCPAKASPSWLVCSVSSGLTLPLLGPPYPCGQQPPRSPVGGEEEMSPGPWATRTPGPARPRPAPWAPVAACSPSCLPQAGSFHKTFSNNQLWGSMTTSSELLFLNLFPLVLSTSLSSPAPGEWGEWISQSSGRGWGLPRPPLPHPHASGFTFCQAAFVPDVRPHIS